MSAKRIRRLQHENAIRDSVFDKAQREIAEAERDAARAELAALKVATPPAQPAPAAPPPPPTLRQQFAAIADPGARAGFLLQHEHALIAEADAARGVR